MDTKAIAITAVFTALTVALSRFIVPAPYFPFVFYEIWEIPIVAVFLFLNPKYGFSILLLNTVVSFAFFSALSNPGLNPIYGIVACSSMLCGVLLASKLNRIIAGENTQQLFQRKYLVFSTALGIVFRVIVMTGFIYATSVWILGIPEPIVITGMLPFIAVFNVTLPLYTIPFGYLIAKTLGKTLKTTGKI